MSKRYTSENDLRARTLMKNSLKKGILGYLSKKTDHDTFDDEYNDNINNNIYKNKSYLGVLQAGGSYNFDDLFENDGQLDY